MLSGGLGALNVNMGAFQCSICYQITNLSDRISGFAAMYVT